MALDNVNKVLSQFEAKNFNALDEKDRAQLAKVEKADCMQAKAMLGDKTVDGVKLKDFIGTLKYNTKKNSKGITYYESFVTINGKERKVNYKSDLGALIQMYVLAHPNTHVGKDGIDGSVGGNTIDGLINAKLIGNGNEGGNGGPEGDNRGKEKGKEVKDELKSRIYELLQLDYRHRVGEYSNAEYNLLETNPGEKEGALKSAKRDGNTEMIEIKYKSAYGKKEMQTIKIDLSQCKIGNDYSANKLGGKIKVEMAAKEHAVKSAIDQAERRKKEEQERKAEAKETADINKSIEKGIKNFVSSNAILKEYVTDKKVNFSVSSIDSKDVKVSVKADGSNLSMNINRSDLLDSDNNFDSSSFDKKIQGDRVMTMARNYVRNKLTNDINQMKKPATLSTVDQLISGKTEYEALKKVINDTYGANEFEQQKNSLQKMINDADAMIAALNNKAEAKAEQQKKVDAMNKIVREISALCKKLDTTGFSWGEKPDLASVVKDMKKYVNISESSNGFVMSEKEDVKAVYEAAGNAYLYTLDLEDLKKALSNYSHQTVTLS